MRNIAAQNAKCHELGINLGLGGPLWLEHVSGSPDPFENVDQIQDQGQFHALRYADLKSALTICQGDQSLEAVRVAAQNFLPDFVHHGGLALGEGGPDTLVFRLGRGLPDCVFGA